MYVSKHAHKACRLVDNERFPTQATHQGVMPVVPKPRIQKKNTYKRRGLNEKRVNEAIDKSRAAKRHKGPGVYVALLKAPKPVTFKSTSLPNSMKLSLHYVDPLLKAMCEPSWLAERGCWQHILSCWFNSPTPNPSGLALSLTGDGTCWLAVSLNH